VLQFLSVELRSIAQALRLSLSPLNGKLSEIQHLIFHLFEKFHLAGKNERY